MSTPQHTPNFVERGSCCTHRTGRQPLYFLASSRRPFLFYFLYFSGPCSFPTFRLPIFSTRQNYNIVSTLLHFFSSSQTKRKPHKLSLFLYQKPIFQQNPTQTVIMREIVSFYSVFLAAFPLSRHPALPPFPAVVAGCVSLTVSLDAARLLARNPAQPVSKSPRWSPLVLL